MDLNYLLSREQVSLMRADVAQCAASRDAHLGFAREYRRRIHGGYPLSQAAIGAGQ